MYLGLRFSPWPLLVLITFPIGIFLIIQSARNWETEPKLLSISYSLMGLSGILFGILKIISDYGLNEYYNVTFGLALTFSLLFFPAVLIGIYQKVKDNEQLRKETLIGISILVVILIMVAALITFGFLFIKH